MRLCVQRQGAARGVLKSEPAVEEVIRNPGQSVYEDAEDLMEEIVGSVDNGDNLKPKVVRMSRLLKQIVDAGRRGKILTEKAKGRREKVSGKSSYVDVDLL